MFIFNDIYQKYISDLDNKDKYRILPELINKKSEYIDFSTNDYLCLSQNEEVIHAAKEATDIYGVGSTGSRLLSGNNKLFMDFERLLAKTKREEKALILNTGFQANFSVLSSLLNQKILKAKPIIFFDKNNHSSLYQAAFLSGAELVRFSHNNMQLLSELLNECKLDNRPKFIVTETLFGMDGDILPIQEIKTLAKKHNAFFIFRRSACNWYLGE